MYFITHRKLQASGVWDEHVRKPPGTSSFVASGTPLRLACFNCGKGGHRVEDCSLPLNQSRIDANKAKYIKNRDASRSKWRPPIASEGGKRIVVGNPFTWNPPANCWISDDTPSSGITPPSPPASLTAATKIPPLPPVINTAADQPSDDITRASTVAQTQIQIAALQRKLATVQDNRAGPVLSESHSAAG